MSFKNTMIFSPTFTSMSTPPSETNLNKLFDNNRENRLLSNNKEYEDINIIYDDIEFINTSIIISPKNMDSYIIPGYIPFDKNTDDVILSNIIKLVLVDNNDITDLYNKNELDIDIIEQKYWLFINDEYICDFSIIKNILFPSNILKWKCRFRIENKNFYNFKNVCDSEIFKLLHVNHDKSFVYINANNNIYKNNIEEFLEELIHNSYPPQIITKKELF